MCASGVGAFVIRDLAIDLRLQQLSSGAAPRTGSDFGLCARSGRRGHGLLRQCSGLLHWHRAVQSPQLPLWGKCFEGWVWSRTSIWHGTATPKLHVCLIECYLRQAPFCGVKVTFGFACIHASPCLSAKFGWANCLADKLISLFIVVASLNNPDSQDCCWAKYYQCPGEGFKIANEVTRREGISLTRQGRVGFGHWRDVHTTMNDCCPSQSVCPHPTQEANNIGSGNFEIVLFPLLDLMLHSYLPSWERNREDPRAPSGRTLKLLTQKAIIMAYITSLPQTLWRLKVTSQAVLCISRSPCGSPLHLKLSTLVDQTLFADH